MHNICCDEMTEYVAYLNDIHMFEILM